MQRIVITAVLAASFGGAALAESPNAVQPDPFVPVATRAQVQAELAAFKASGVNPWSTSYDLLSEFRSTKIRAQATAEYLEARDEVQAFTGEDSGAARLRMASQPVPAGRHLATR